MSSTLFIFLSAALFQVSLSIEYNYNFSDTTNGPLGWANTFPVSCKGSRQSPIDIKASEASYDDSLGKLTFTNYDNVPSGSMLKLGNSGKSYRVFFEPNTFLVSEGGLPGKFYTHNIHFHWGADNTNGSEHTINGKKFPLELHFVNVNTKYPNVSEALKNEDGLAALGVLYEVGDENLALKPFLQYTANVTYKGPDISNVTMTQALHSLLPPNTSDFYRYDGSLTTPSCQEVVTWTVFKNYLTISQAQLNMLRSLRADNTTMLVDTFRPVQPLGSRVVKKTFKTATTSHGEASHVTNAMTIIMSIVMATVLSK